MSQESSPYAVSKSAVSPITSSNMPPATPSKIAKVFGIIHIVFAALGMLTALASLGVMAAMKAIVGQLDGQAKELDKVMKAYEGIVSYAYLDLAIKLVLGIVLIVAGIGLLKKKKWAIGASIGWAVVRIIVAIAMIVVMAGPTQAFQEKINSIGGSEGAQMEQFQNMASGVGNIVGVIMVCVYPVLCIIFLSKKSAKQGLS